jgi:hypothetical protein
MPGLFVVTLPTPAIPKLEPIPIDVARLDPEAWGFATTEEMEAAFEREPETVEG